MRKTQVIRLLLICILFILGGIFFIFLTQNYLTGIIIRDYYSYTKAICDNTNYCEDYEIICNDKEIIGINPTGAAVQFPSDWKDPRDEKTIKNFCE